MARLEQSIYISRDDSKAPLAFDNSENSLLATSIKAIDTTLEWLANTKAIGKQKTNITDARILKHFIDYVAYLFDDVKGIKGSQAVLISDINTRGYGFESIYNNLRFYNDFIIDLLTNTYTFTIQYDGSSWFYAFTDIMDLFPGSTEFFNPSYEKALFTTSDELSGGDLNDKLYGYAGNDLLFGNAGDDTIAGGLGNDSLVGNTGNDNISGEEGDDMIWGSAGNDVLTGEDGNDEIFGGTGGDGTKTLGQDGDDIIYGEGGNDKLWGEDGKDIIYGGIGDDYIHGGFENDELYGGDGNDLIHGGNGRDIISGGAGRDELHGAFGSNIYKSNKDGSSDLIAIKSDQYLSNWYFGKAGNNPNGEKCDLIESLDAIDRIKIIGVNTRDISFAANVVAQGVTGIGIYGKGALEALYIGGDLSISQLTTMTTGDASAAAMSNSINSYGTW